MKSVTVPFPEAVAVDNCGAASTSCDETEDPSVGDVYVAGAKKGNKGKLGEEEYLYKFNSNLEAIGNHKFKESIDGLAVDRVGVCSFTRVSTPVRSPRSATRRKTFPLLQRLCGRLRRGPR